MTKAIELTVPRARFWAFVLGLNFKNATASSTLARFLSETVGTLLITRETVVIETLARLATSSMLIFFLTTAHYLTISPTLIFDHCSLISAAAISFLT